MVPLMVCNGFSVFLVGCWMFFLFFKNGFPRFSMSVSLEFLDFQMVPFFPSPSDFLSLRRISRDFQVCFFVFRISQG